MTAIAPFLSYDPDPYMVIGDDGKLFWMIDAYTESSHLPYSKPLSGGTNYVRNSVKVVVDAYDGSVSFYVVDRNDILAKDLCRYLPDAVQAGREICLPTCGSISGIPGRSSRSRPGCSRPFI